MGRTATAFLVLVAVGGCVADDQGPTAAVFAGQHGQPMAAGAPTYAIWNKPDQFAALQDGPATTPTTQQPASAPVRMTTTTTALKPTGPHKPVVVPAPAADQDAAPTPPAVDPDLVQATMVQVPGNSEPTSHDTAAPAAPPATPAVVKAKTVRKPVVVPTPTEKTAPAAPAADPDLEQTAPVQPLVNSEPPAIHDAPAAAPRPNGLTLEAEQTAANLASASTRMVNSKRITLNYELKDAANAGVTGVELWCTQDTRAWKKGEIVAETNHSYTVEVKDEGLYGFTLLPRGGPGGKEAPQPGDQPQVWVSVDVTKPVVQITSLELTRAGKAPGLMIRWTAKDKNMSPRPINLSYAEEAEGPWTPIAAGLENNGQYEWQPLSGAPHHLYVRVEAADLHGNVGVAQTANPLRVDVAGAVALPQPEAARKPLPLASAPPAVEMLRPSAAILGVEPNDN